jgi:hypothetical protein
MTGPSTGIEPIDQALIDRIEREHLVRTPPAEGA